MWGFIWAGLSQWANELWGTGEKASPLANNNWAANVWEFPLLRGSVAAMFRALQEGRGHLFGRVCHNGLMNYWTPVKKQAFLRTITGLLTSGNFRYYAGLSPASYRALPDGVGIYLRGSVASG